MHNHSPFKHYHQRSSNHNQLHIQDNVSIKKNILQQKQIDELQKKIDIILMHNEKLIQENMHLKNTIGNLDYASNTERYLQGNTARFIAQQTQLIINKLKRQNQIARGTYEMRLKQLSNQKSSLKQEILTLNQIIKNTKVQNETLKQELNQNQIIHEEEIYKLKQQMARSLIEAEQKYKDELLIKQQSLKKDINQIQKQFSEEKQKKEKQKEIQKAQIKQNFEKIIIRSNQNHQKQIQQIKKQMEKYFNSKSEELQEAFNQKLRAQRQKSQSFIKQTIQNIKSDEINIKNELQTQIQSLKKSLESRKILINQLINCAEQSQTQNNWYDQFIELKRKVKSITDHYLKQSQILKVKLTQKHQIDIKSMVKIYQDKIDLMTLHIRRVQSQNDHLRNIYEDALNKKISQKKQFQIQISKLKNLIRKLKVELHGIQQQFKINIQGVKSNNNTFSMTMMKSMIQIKDKANFYEEQNRKLRKAYEEHQIQVHQAKKQANEKATYFQEKYVNLKQKMEEKLQQLRQNEQNLISDSQKRENMLRQSLEKQHQTNKYTIQTLRQKIQLLEKQINELKNRNHDLQLTFKQKQEDIAYYRTLAQQKQADIQRLKMDLQMAGVNDQQKIDTINQWRNHYQRQLEALNSDKQILQNQLQQKQNNLRQMIKKYKILQGSVQKSVQTLKKRSILDKKVMELGLDNNLVKNLAEIFNVEK